MLSVNHEKKSLQSPKNEFFVSKSGIENTSQSMSNRKGVPYYL